MLGILVPRPGIKPAAPVLGVWNLNHWPSREVPNSSVLVFGLFWVNSYIWCEEGVQPHLFLHMHTRLLEHHLLKDYSFLIEMSWHILLVFMTCKTYWREVKEIAEKFLDESWTVIIHSSYSVLCLSQAWSHLIFTKPPGGTLWLFSFYTQRSQGLERLRSLPEGLLLRTSGAGLEIHVHPTPALQGTIIGSCQK